MEKAEAKAIQNLAKTYASRYEKILSKFKQTLRNFSSLGASQYFTILQQLGTEVTKMCSRGAVNEKEIKNLERFFKKLERTMEDCK